MEQVYVIDQHLVPCTMKHVSFDPSLYTSLDLNNSFCLTNGTFQLKGYLNELTNYYAASELYICNNATSVVPCQSIDIINQYFNNRTMYFAVSFHSVVVSSNDYNTPFKSKIIDQTQMIDTKLTKKLNIFFQNVQLFTDDGVLFPNVVLDQGFSYESLQQDLISRNLDSQPLVMLRFWGTNKIEQISRRYEKLPETLGQLTGMTNMIMIFGFIIANVKTNLDTLKITLNELFLFSKSQSKSFKMKTKKGKKVKNNKKINEEATKYQSQLENIQIHEKYNDCSIENLKSLPNVHNSDLLSPYIYSISPKFEEKHSLSFDLPKTPNFTSKNFHSDINKTNKTNSDEKIFSFKTYSDNQKGFHQHQIDQVKQKPDSFILEHYSCENEDGKEFEIKLSSEKTEINANKKVIIEAIQIPLDSCLQVQRKKKPSQSVFPMMMKSVIEFFTGPKILNSENKIDISLYQYLLHKIGFRNELIEQAEDIFNEEVDIIKILKSLHEIEKLKLILFDEDQYILFDSITKPYSPLTVKNKDLVLNKMTSMLESLKGKKSDENIKIQAYQRILKRSEKFEGMDKKIIDLIKKMSQK